jgi:hypothetical protein
MTKFLLAAAIAGCFAFSSVAEAGSAYDGSWDLVFVTRRGACDSFPPVPFPLAFHLDFGKQETAHKMPRSIVALRTAS